MSMEQSSVPTTQNISFSYCEVTEYGSEKSFKSHYQTITLEREFLNFQIEELRAADYLENPPTWINKAASGMHQDTNFFGGETFGGLFTGETYAVKVGKGKAQKTFNVHETALRKCAPFAAAIEPGRWLESHTRQLDMTEEDPDIFINLLEYLYTGEFAPKFKIFDDRKTISTLIPQRQDAAYELTRLYCLSDQYCLESIKPLIIEKLNFCEVTPATFLQIAAYAYDVLPEQDTYCIFKRWARNYIKDNKARLSECTEMQTVVEKGGNLAWDIFRQSFIIRVC